MNIFIVQSKIKIIGDHSIVQNMDISIVKFQNGFMIGVHVKVLGNVKRSLPLIWLLSLT
jgi:hypothetical protein